LTQTPIIAVMGGVFYHTTILGAFAHK